MNSIGERELRNLSAAVILDAITNIKKCRINLQQGERPDKDLKWLHDPDSSFPLWCEPLDISPSKFRKMFPLSLANQFYTHIRIQKSTRRIKCLSRK